MQDDNLNNDDFNQPEVPESFDSFGGVNPESEMPEAQEPAFQQAGVEPQAVNYNFDEIQGTPANDDEVKIDPNLHSSDPVTVRPVEFTPFDSYTPTNTDTNKNLELLMDIKLELTVELGRCQLPVKKVLELTRGSIIELDKVAGESVELYANGKHVANGEVVVIEDNFGLRITSITDPEERIKSL